MYIVSAFESQYQPTWILYNLFLAQAYPSVSFHYKEWGAHPPRSVFEVFYSLSVEKSFRTLNILYWLWDRIVTFHMD